MKQLIYCMKRKETGNLHKDYGNYVNNHKSQQYLIDIVNDNDYH